MSVRTEPAGVNLGCDIVGSGRPLLVLHGFRMDRRSMRAPLEPVFEGRPGWRRTYLDLPGHGIGAVHHDVASSDDVLTLVEGFVDRTLGVEPFAVVGMSYGGAIADALARHRPAQVTGVALLAPVVVHDTEKRRLPKQQVLVVDDAFEHDGAVRSEFDEFAVLRTSGARKLFEAEVGPGLESGDARAQARIKSSYGLTEPLEMAVHPHPSLIVTARQDHVVGYEDHLALIDRFPRATFAVLDKAGHNILIEQRPLIRQLVGEWLDRLDAHEPER